MGEERRKRSWKTGGTSKKGSKSQSYKEVTKYLLAGEGGRRICYTKMKKNKGTKKAQVMKVAKRY